MTIPAFTADQIEQARKIFAGPCDFIWGSASLDQLPVSPLNEVAFAGRSNVGKSSLINALTGRQTLAHTSSMPGRTQQLNFFNLGGRIHMVDMPGYGYAKVSKEKRADWDYLIFNYLRGRVSLRCVFILIDARQGLRDTDHHLMDLLDQAAVPYRVVLTKIDKVTADELHNVKSAVVQDLKKHPAAFPDLLETSAQKSIGLESLRALIITFV